MAALREDRFVVGRGYRSQVAAVEEVRMVLVSRSVGHPAEVEGVVDFAARMVAAVRSLVLKADPAEDSFAAVVLAAVRYKGELAAAEVGTSDAKTAAAGWGIAVAVGTAGVTWSFLGGLRNLGGP